MILMQITAICIFSILLGEMKMIHSTMTASLMMKKISGQAREFLYKIDMSLKNDMSLDYQDYELAIYHISQKQINGMSFCLRNGGYFKNLNPRLRKLLCQNLFELHYQKFYYFFHDIQNNNNAHPQFVHKIIESLDF